MLLSISYDSSTADRPQRCDEVAAVIAQHASEVKRPLYSQWLVETDDDVPTWTTWLTRILGTGDRMLITRVHRPVDGWLDEEEWTWINARTQ